METKQRKISLKGQEKPIVEAKRQLEILEGTLFNDGLFSKFTDKLSSLKELPLTVNELEIFQVNIGYICNQVVSIVTLMLARIGKK